ncbi:MAG TPA: sensor histidine kinase [Gaiellaceae bacterium]|nr:sensor histidine kinase [Gaiellaceae bacterium]
MQPIRSRLRLWAVVVAGVAGALLTAIGIGLDGVAAPDPWSLARGAVVASYVGVGLYTWWRRPLSSFGVALAQVGLLYAVASLTASSDPWIHTVGRVTLAGVVVYLAYTFLRFPGDRLATGLERGLVGSFVLTTVLTWVVALPLVDRLPVGGPLADCAARCPDNPVQVVSTPESVSTAIASGVNGATAIVLIAVIVLLVGKASSPARLRRRLVVPVLASAVALAASYTAYTVIRGTGVEEVDVLRVAGAAATIAIPFAMLVGQVRGRVFAATHLVDLVARVGREPVTPARVEGLLRDELGDPLLRVALHSDGGWVDVHAHPIELPVHDRNVGVTPVVRRERTVAALVHDVALDEGDVADGLAATALMLLENAQLVDELRASRARIVASGQRERLRLERNLHDGAQQRLFAIQMKLGEARATAHDPELRRALDELTADAVAAAEELRELAHGLYPTVLRGRGLADGLRAAARGAAIPVRVTSDVAERCSPTVEEAVYFCVLEAIQNAAKHAGPGAHVAVTLERYGDELRFSVADDGAGFDPDASADGIGLVSMRDRVGAVGGTLDVISAPGRGTTVLGVVPETWPGDGAEPRSSD